MYTMSNNELRQPANSEKIDLLKDYGYFYSPTEDANGNLYLTTQSGEIIKINENSDIEELVFEGQPVSIIFDSNNNMYVSDLCYNCVVMRKSDNENSGFIPFITDYEGIKLKGPTSMSYNKEDNILYICDSGLLGTVTLDKPSGSIYLYDLNTNYMRPLLYNCLAGPNAIVYDNIRGNLYVAETMANRIIRLTQNTSGIYYASVFCQFSGRFGPMSLAIDELGNLYVARFEFQHNIQNDKRKETEGGIISVVNSEGVLVGELSFVEGSEINGVYISQNKKDQMFVTEKYSKSILKVKLESFVEHIKKLEEYNKQFN